MAWGAKLWSSQVAYIDPSQHPLDPNNGPSRLVAAKQTSVVRYRQRAEASEPTAPS